MTVDLGKCRKYLDEAVARIHGFSGHDEPLANICRVFDDMKAEVDRLVLRESELLTKLQAADVMAQTIDYAVQQHIINSRSAMSDARLDYGEPRKYEFTSSS